MFRQLVPVSALFLGSAFLLFAGGMNGLILALRGTHEGFDPFALGLLGTGYSIGYVSGCITAPALVGKVGHIRAFSVMCAMASIAVLVSVLFVDPAAWIPLRAVSGYCFAGAAMIVESWLSERATAQTRGRIFGVYTMVNLVASTGGQMMLALGDVQGMLFFVLAAIFYSLALVPTAASNVPTPKPLVRVRLDIRSLWRNSPVAVVAVLMVGFSNGTFGTLAAVYALKISLPEAAVALFASVGILVGAAVQIPVGYLSDRFDRRHVLIGIAGFGLAVETVFIALSPESVILNLALAGALGAAIYSMYPVIIAHANDHAPPDSGIQVSGGLLMMYGFGAIAGPLVAGLLMSSLGARGMFIASLAAHVLLIGFLVWRLGKRGAVAPTDKTRFQAAPLARSSTPQTVAMAAELQSDQPLGSGD